MTQNNEPDGPDPAAPASGQPAPGAEPGPGDQRPASSASGSVEPPAWTGGQPAQYGTAPGYGQTMAFGQPANWGPPGSPGYGSAGGAISAEPSPILVSFAAPARQRRVIVLFRYLLAIPHLVVLYALGIAAEVVAFIGWFAALFTGQLPDWAHIFLTGVLRWQTRLYGYLFMLTDVYPPFSLDDDAYPVRLVSRQTKLNWLAVLFRIILVIPAGILAAVAAFGLAVLSFFVWLIALVTGGLPPAVHEAVAAIVRYHARYIGFYVMVTSQYPGGLYGDAASAVTPFPAVPDSMAGGPAPYVAPTAEAVQPGSASTDSQWRLVLSSAAKSLVTVCLIVGVVATAAYVIVIAVVGRNAANTAGNAVALTQVEQANSVLGKSMASFPAGISACGGQLTCVTTLDSKLGASLQTFAGAIKAISLSGPASSAATRLVSDTNAAAQDLDQLGSSTSVAQYQSYASSGHLQLDLNNVSADFATLARDLSS